MGKAVNLYDDDSACGLVFESNVARTEASLS